MGLLFLVVALAAPTAAQATILTQTFSIPFSGSGLPRNTPDNVLVPQFDPSLGSLIEVNLQLTANHSGSGPFSGPAASAAVWENQTASPVSGIELAYGVRFDAAAPAGLAVSARSLAPIQIGSVDAAGGADQFRVGFGTGTDTVAANLISPPADLSAYVGLGNITVEVSKNPTAHWTAPGSPLGTLILSRNAEYDGNVDVIYAYMVPEPSSIVLAGIALPLLTFRPRWGRPRRE